MTPLPRPPRTRLHAQSGASLVSTLVAVLALALGLLAATRAQSQLRAGSESARQRVEAVRLAGDEIERLRALPRIGAGDDGRGLDGLSDATRGAASPVDATAYRIERRVTGGREEGRHAVQVEVSWHDHAGGPHSVRLSTLLARVDPALRGVLTQPSRGRPLGRVRGRDVRIPLAARDLGDGRSLLGLGAAGRHAAVVDNATGAVLALCRFEADGTAQSVGRADRDAACTPVAGGLLVTGRVRFSFGDTPSAAAPGDAPPAFDVSLVLESATAMAPRCATERRSADGERWVDYACVVVPAAGTAGWTGRVELVPDGWEIGTTAGRHRVCRYSADHDASGAVDRPHEHPGRQRNVVAALAEQNFLVVAGPRDCPRGTPVEVGGRGTENHADLSTAQHQP